MAKVYRATDLTLERQVAVKTDEPELRSEAGFDERFNARPKLVGQLADPHIVTRPRLRPGQHLRSLPGHGVSARSSLRERLATEGPLPLKAGSN